MSAISAAEAAQIIRYDPETGEFFWLQSRGKRIKAGQRAGSVLRGYLYVRIGCRKYRANRLAFLLVTGRWPIGLVDHKNRDSLDNRWLNLREATHSQNSANCSSRRKTGLKGVKKQGRRFQAFIRKDGVRRYLGTFNTEKDAHSAYVTAARKLHGEFACAV